MRRLVTTVTLLAAVAITLSGCGKSGRPVTPPDATYPRTYPSRALGPTPATQKEGKALAPEWDQQDLKEAYGPGGSYIDSSMRQLNPALLGIGAPTQNLPNTQPSQAGMTPFDQGLNPSNPTPLPPVESTFPTQPTPSTDQQK
ncbi:MAG TPA: hypothetical protein VK558_03885 [Patescibacteria group bacterium]|nr:hypothetical protein [Patescibacteria group bacterium]